jgi:hypothetical protein
MRSGFKQVVSKWAAGATLACSTVTAMASAGGAAGLAPCGPETTFSPSSDYAFTFRVCGDSLVGTVTARAVGWVALGFGRDQFMPVTDTFMAGVLPDATTYGVDGFAFLRNPPVPDASQDVTLLAASEIDGVTRYSFSRLLNTGDTADFDLTDGEYHILAAFQSSSDDLTVRHSFADASELTYRFAPVPEPATLAMLLAGLGLLALRVRAQR